MMGHQGLMLALQHQLPQQYGLLLLVLLDIKASLSLKDLHLYWRQQKNTPAF